MPVLATAYVEISAKTEKFKRGISQSKRAMQDFGRRVDREVRKMERDWEGLFNTMRRGGQVIAGLGIALGAMGTLATRSFLQAAVAREKLMMGLKSVAGSAEEANRQLEELRETAKLPGLGLSEAIQGSINLQAVRFSAQKANRYLMEMGNALATVGKGREDLMGVVRGMQQMQSRGKVLAEEINQISERVPQFRAAMLDAFGTATSEEIQKLGITVEEFLDRTVNELAKLPRVAGGTANAIENLTDAWTELKVALGKELIPAFAKIIAKIADLVDWFNKLTGTEKKIVAWGAVTVATFGAVSVAAGGLMMALPGMAGGFTSLGVAAKTALPALVPFAAGVAVAGAGIASVALALREYKKAKKDVFTEQEMKIIQRNVEGYAAAIKQYERGIVELQKHSESGMKEVSLLGVGIDTLSKSVQPVPDLIKELEVAIADTKVEMRKAQGDIFGVTKSLKGADVAAGTAEAAFADLKKSLEALKKVGPLDFLDLGNIMPEPALERVRGMGKAIGDLRENLEELPELSRKLDPRKAEASWAKLASGIFVQIGVDADELDRGLKKAAQRKEELKRIMGEFAAATLSEKENLDRLWLEEQTRLRKLGMTSEEIDKARFNHFRVYNEKIEADATDFVQRMVELQGVNLANETANLERIRDKGADIDEEKKAIVGSYYDWLNDLRDRNAAREDQEAKNFIEQMRADQKARMRVWEEAHRQRIRLLSQLTNAQKQYFDTIIGYTHDYETMSVGALQRVVRAWNKGANDIEKGFHQALIITVAEQKNWREHWLDVIGDVQYAFANFIEDSMMDIDNMSDAWEAFCEDMKRIFVRKISELLADAAFRALQAEIAKAATGGGGGVTSVGIGSLIGGIVGTAIGTGIGGPIGGAIGGYLGQAIGGAAGNYEANRNASQNVTVNVNQTDFYDLDRNKIDRSVNQAILPSLNELQANGR